MEDPYFRKAAALIIILVLLVVSFLIIRPIILSIIFGFILAFIFSPIYKLLLKLTKMPTLSAAIITIFLLLIIILPLWFFTPTLIEQGLKFYDSAQKADYVTPLKTIFPSLFASEQFSTEIGGVLHSFITKTANSFLNYLEEFILNLPTIMLQFLVILFTFFFALRDKDSLLDYIKNLLPFSKEIERKIFQYSKDITASVLYGEVIVGLLQGIIMAIGFFLFGVPNALLLSVLVTLMGILPIVGPMIVWLPVLFYMLISGNSLAAIGILVFGLIASNVDNPLKSLLISKMTKVHSAVILVGMIGGLFMFGLLGLIIGPLILSYLLIIFEVFRGNRSSSTPYYLLRED